MTTTKPLLILLFLTIITLLPSSPESRRIPLLGKHSHSLHAANYTYQIRYFQQTLNHFGFDDLPKFPQRYLINTDHWSVPLGPIFLYCGNEGDIEWFAANSGFVWELAPRFRAMVIFPEHRYYGESMPYGSKDEAYKNISTLAHLTSTQALADFAVLITDLKRNLSSEASPVILFGGSYGGMLAAWMRLKYPHIAIGALAASAPVLQFEDLVPPETFYNIVSNDFKRESTSCFDTIKKSWDVITSLSRKVNGLHHLAKTFHLCGELKSSNDLINWLDSAYSNLAMVDYPYPADFLMPLPAYPIKEVCKVIDDSANGANVLDRIFKGVNVYYNYTGESKCFDLDDDPHGMGGWDWQACTEMIMPMSSDKDSSMFPEWTYNYTSYAEECVNEFGVKPRPTWITTEFGGHDYKDVFKKFGSNIIFSNGRLDPWSGGGVVENISDSIVALVTEEGAHHLDLRAARTDDPDWLVAQRESEVKIIKGWIDDYYATKKAAFDM
ncbi:uncharacterized protein LOC143624066 [Bidens hawaiensis]|uniref:uncharacterized protein LOC143624066 n=1 Tax=Bidens hawaiensis TaxID=980011 RepID=UPI004049B688